MYAYLFRGQLLCPMMRRAEMTRNTGMSGPLTGRFRIRAVRVVNDQTAVRDMSAPASQPTVHSSGGSSS